MWRLCAGNTCVSQSSVAEKARASSVRPKVGDDHDSGSAEQQASRPRDARDAACESAASGGGRETGADKQSVGPGETPAIDNVIKHGRQRDSDRGADNTSQEEERNQQDRARGGSSCEYQHDGRCEERAFEPRRGGQRPSKPATD